MVFKDISLLKFSAKFSSMFVSDYRYILKGIGDRLQPCLAPYVVDTSLESDVPVSITIVVCLYKTFNAIY